MIHEKFSTPELSNSLEDYIEAVRNIELEKGCAIVGEIAESLNVKKPSASLLRGPGHFLPYHGEGVPHYGAEDGGKTRR